MNLSKIKNDRGEKKADQELRRWTVNHETNNPGFLAVERWEDSYHNLAYNHVISIFRCVISYEADKSEDNGD